MNFLIKNKRALIPTNTIMAHLLIACWISLMMTTGTVLKMYDFVELDKNLPVVTSLKAPRGEIDASLELDGNCSAYVQSFKRFWFALIIMETILS